MMSSSLENFRHLIARGISEHFVRSSHKELRNVRVGRKIRNASWLEFGFVEPTSMMTSLTWAISSVDVKRMGQLVHFIRELLLIESDLKCSLVSKL
jgi:hypothetical protein